jgi:hypothetical protein
MSASVASVDFYNEDSASPLTVTKPAGFASSEILVAIFVTHGPSLSSMTAPTNWTEQGNFTTGTGSGDCQGKVFSYVFLGGDPATWDFPYNSTDDVCLSLYRVSGADTTPTIVVASTAMPTIATPADSPTVNPSGSDDLLICSLANICNGTAFTEVDPSGMTDNGQTQVAGNFMALAVASEQLSSPSATGVRSWTSVVPTGLDGGTFSVAIKSAPSTTTSVSQPVTQNAILYLLLLSMIQQQRFNSEATTLDQILQMDGIQSAEALGSPSVTTTYTVNATGIQSSEKFGSPSVTTTYSINPTGIQSSEATGSPSVTATYSISATGVPSSEKFGSPSVTTTYNINATGIPSSEIVGSSVIGLSVSATGIPSSEGFGNPSVTTTYTINATGIPSGEQVGNTNAGTATFVSVIGITSTEKFGNPAVTVVVGINPIGISSQETFGNPSVTTTYTVNATGIPSTEKFGIASASYVINTYGIPSSERFGAASLTPGQVTISPTGIKSEERLGQPDVAITAPSGTVQVSAIPSGERFGQPHIGPAVHIDVIAAGPRVVVYIQDDVVIANAGPDIVG